MGTAGRRTPAARPRGDDRHRRRDRLRWRERRNFDHRRSVDRGNYRLGRQTGTGGITGSGGTGSGGQVASTVNTIDPAPTTNETAGTSKTGAKFNYYSTSAARTLVQIEMFMSPTDPQLSPSTRWVFESASTSGPWASIPPPTTTDGTTGQGYQSSGPITVPLLAAHYYAIGVQWATATDYWYHQLGSVAVGFGPCQVAPYCETPTPPVITYSPTTYYAQRLTTTP